MPSAGSASSRRIRNDRMPIASAPSQYAAWSSTKTASSRAARPARRAPPGRSRVGLGHAHLEREHDRVRLPLEPELVHDRAGRVVAVAPTIAVRSPRARSSRNGRDRVLPQVDAVLGERLHPGLVELVDRAPVGRDPRGFEDGRRGRPRRCRTPRMLRACRVVVNARRSSASADPEPILELGAHRRPLGPGQRVVQVEQDRADLAHAARSRIARTCSIVVAG